MLKLGEMAQLAHHSSQEIILRRQPLCHLCGMLGCKQNIASLSSYVTSLLELLLQQMVTSWYKAERHMKVKAGGQQPREHKEEAEFRAQEEEHKSLGQKLKEQRRGSLC
uniref:Uncharacterized protein n=1 Tax=Sphaerodactylus townsendi TaxID=933632 RepID=A0ACB8FEP7_9SAUR